VRTVIANRLRLAALISAALAVAAVPAHACTRPAASAPKRQLRAMWIATVENMDWPSKPGLSIARQKAQYIRLLDQAKRFHFNAVIVQIRPTADAFWPSTFEPWSHWLTGVQGRDPGYDPLAFLIAQAHARGLELHAWFNPYRVSLQGDLGKLAPDHPARRHPNWIVSYDTPKGKLFYNPGIPAVRRFVEDDILDVVRRYDIDGVHLDDYFYPYPNGHEFDDAAAFTRYGAGFTDRAAWRRHNVDMLVQELSERIHAAKPWVAFGISPFGVWRNRATDPAGSDTRAGAQSYDDLYADVRTWVRRGWIDYVAPQLYWNIGFALADYAKLVPWWSAQVAGTRVQLVIGQAAYRVGAPGAWSDPRELARHLAFDRRYPRVRGDIWFSAKDVLANRLNSIGIVARSYYRRPALVPAMSAARAAAPAPPAVIAAQQASRGVRLTWRPDADSEYAVYRFAGRRAVTRCDIADARHLLAVLPRGTSSFADATASRRRTYTYAVTTIDRLRLEGPPAVLAARTG
jgi:uncharacterized lipoprotein YddW (UPF0748 family)